MMLYWKEPNGERLYGTEKEAPRGAVPVKVPHDHEGLLNYLNEKFAHQGGAEHTTHPATPKMDARSILGRGNWWEKINHIAIDRLSDQDQDKAIDMVAKYNNGVRFTPPMQNLVDVLFKKSHRLGDFHNYDQ